MDLPKLLDMLHSSSLYLRRADGFSDRLEGTYPKSYRNILDTEYNRGESEYDGEEFYRRSTAGNYVSCWSIGATDNMALWQLYGGTRTSIAITTTLHRLASVCRLWRRETVISQVKYIDHRKWNCNGIGIDGYTFPLEHKNIAYTYEQEIRIIVPHQVSNWKDNPMAIRLPLYNINSLVRSVVVSPDAEIEFKEAIQDLCSKYGLSAPVRTSVLGTTAIR